MLKVRSSYSRATTTIIRGNEGILSGIITASLSRRGLCNNIIPRVTSHHRTRSVDNIIARTLLRTGYALTSVRTVTIACTPKLVNTLLINIGFTGKLSTTSNGPLIPIRRLHSRVTTGCLASSLRPPFLYLIIDNNRSRVITMGDCASCGVVNGAHSSTTNRTLSGTNHAVNLRCPNNVDVSGVDPHNGTGTFSFPRPGVTSTPCSFSFDKLGASIVGAIRGSTRGKGPVGATSLTTSFRGTIISYLVDGFRGTTISFNCGGVILTNNISTGSLLETRDRGVYTHRN